MQTHAFQPTTLLPTEVMLSLD